MFASQHKPKQRVCSQSRPPARPPAGAVGERLPASADRDLYKGESQEQEATEEGMKGDEEARRTREGRRRKGRGSGGTSSGLW